MRPSVLTDAGAPPASRDAAAIADAATANGGRPLPAGNRDAGGAGEAMQSGAEAGGLAPDASVLAHDAGSPGTGGGFVDVTAAAGLAYRQAPIHLGDGTDWYATSGLEQDAVYFSGGAAAGDFDRDGFTDLYVTRLDKYGLLFRNLGDGRFEDVTAAAGLDVSGFRSIGAVWADVDNDGDPDLYVTALGGVRYHLFVNEGGIFQEDAQARGAAIEDAEPRQGFSASAGDYDRDGFLDLHSCEWQFDMPAKPRPSHSRLLRNRGSEGGSLVGHFEDVTEAAGVVLGNVDPDTPVGDQSFASTFSDLDADGYPELVVASDFGTSRLYWNAGDGTFVNGTASAGVGGDRNGMGSAIGDYDGDGLLDWFVSAITCTASQVPSVDCTGNRLYRNQGDRTFADHTDLAGVREGGWGWGSSFFDFDNDGDLDLAVTNGVRFSSGEFPDFRSDTTRLFENQGGVLRDRAFELGLRDAGDGKGLLVLDYDRDGDLDLYVVQHVLGGRLYRNDLAPGRSWLRVALTGASANRQAVGARVRAKAQAGAAWQVQELRAGSNYLGQDESVVHFGLGEGVSTVAEVEITWPNPGTRKVSLLRDVTANAVLEVVEP